MKIFFPIIVLIASGCSTLGQQNFTESEYLANDSRASGYRDTDNDGIRDFQDVCFNSRPGSVVNVHGCKETTQRDLVVAGPCQLPDLVYAAKTFAFDSWTVTTPMQWEIDFLMQDARALGNMAYVEVEGYADPIGTSDYNMGLSQKRAEAISNELNSSKRIVKARRVTGNGETDQKPGRFAQLNVEYDGCGKLDSEKVSPTLATQMTANERHSQKSDSDNRKIRRNSPWSKK